MLRDPTQQQGEGGGKNQLATKFRKNAPQVCNFLNSFVQDWSLLRKQQASSCYASLHACGLQQKTSTTNAQFTFLYTFF